MKALVIAPQPFFTARGTPMSVYYRSLVMADQGVEIDLLTYGEGRNVLIPGLRIVRIPKFGYLGRVKTGPSLLKMFLDVFIGFWAFGLLLRRRYDVVHAHEEAVFVALILKPLFRFKLIYDMHSSLPEQLRNFGWSNSRFLHGLTARAEFRALRHADALITICPALAEYALSRIGGKDKHVLIENSIFWPVKYETGSDPDTGGIDVDRVFAELKANGPVWTCLYAGTLEPYQGIDLLLQSMVHVLRDEPRVRLVVVGGFPQQTAYYEKEADSLGIADVCRFFSRVPQTAAKAFMANADVIVSPRAHGMNTPLKVYECLDSGKPLVATRITSHTQVLDDSVAFLADPAPEAFGAEIVKAIRDTETASEKAESARQLYAEKYAASAYADKIGKLLRLVS